MLFWIINLSAMGIYGLLTKLYHRDKLFLFMACIHMGMIMALRSINVGTDTHNYAFAFDIIKSGRNLSASHAAASSKVFLLLLRGFSFLPRTQGYMIITSVPVIISLYIWVKNFSENYYLSVTTFITSYLLFYSMNAARHFLAIALIFLCFMLLENRRIFYSIAIFLLACAVHNAVSMFILYYFIYMVKWNKTRFAVFVVGLTVMMKAIPPLISLFIIIFPHYAWLSSKVFDQHYVSGGRTSLVYAFYSLLTILLYFISVRKNRNILTVKIGLRDIAGGTHTHCQNSQFIFRVSCIMSTSAVMLGMYSSSILISRMAYVFFAFIVFALPNALNHAGNSRFWITAVYVPFAVFMFLQLQGNYSGVLNYSFGF